MSPTCDSAPKGETSELILGQSNFLSMLLVAQLREGDIVQLDVDGSDRVFGYAVTDEGGTDIVLVSMEDPQETGSSPVALDLPEGLTITEAAILTGDDLEARNISSLTPWSPVAEVEVEGEVEGEAEQDGAENAVDWHLPAGSILALRAESESSAAETSSAGESSTPPETSGDDVSDSTAEPTSGP